jgi:hypothetical protein
LLLQEQGPLWYRGYFGDRGPAAASPADVDAALAHFGVRRIVVGHTRVPATTALYGGKVLAVHVYPKREDDGRVTFEGLLSRGGSLLRALPDGTTQPLN